MSSWIFFALLILTGLVSINADGERSHQGALSANKRARTGLRRMTLHHTGRHSAAEVPPMVSDQMASPPRQLGLMSSESRTAADFATPAYSKFLDEAARNAEKRRSREDATASAVANDEDRTVDIHSTFDSLAQDDEEDVRDADWAGVDAF
eukprot:gnl/MRDRNA2_/MRDRNA2_83797_c0_seq1.p1 gnl/MRDRNA2_/MRDRNA2_83797_c0~~gnl/MRDRNA2_/MRDRNA2_83797_c0_seq1.p1  ORF type:complete len:151 (+),score=39.18 gnl/MRDRNA2_/MRDRNA2_83797_c0_seq1:88-540(+)